MTFEEWKEYTKAALELAGDVDPGARASIVVAAIGKHVMMPSDLAEMQSRRSDFAGAVPVRGNAGAIGGQLVPRIG